MNELAKKWVAELRSGKYKQARRVLRTPNDKFCCLGVLCDIVDPEGWENEAISFTGGPAVGFSRKEDPFSFRDVFTFPPLAFLYRVGLSLPRANELAVMNDQGASFEVIANKIEEFLS